MRSGKEIKTEEKQEDLHQVLKDLILQSAAAEIESKKSPEESEVIFGGELFADNMVKSMTSMPNLTQGTIVKIKSILSQLPNEMTRLMLFQSVMQEIPEAKISLGKKKTIAVMCELTFEKEVDYSYAAYIPPLSKNIYDNEISLSDYKFITLNLNLDDSEFIILTHGLLNCIILKKFAAEQITKEQKAQLDQQLDRIRSVYLYGNYVEAKERLLALFLPKNIKDIPHDTYYLVYKAAQDAVPPIIDRAPERRFFELQVAQLFFSDEKALESIANIATTLFGVTFPSQLRQDVLRFTRQIKQFISLACLPRLLLPALKVAGEGYIEKKKAKCKESLGYELNVIWRQHQSTGIESYVANASFGGMRASSPFFYDKINRESPRWLAESDISTYGDTKTRNYSKTLFISGISGHANTYVSLLLFYLEQFHKQGASKPTGKAIIDFIYGVVAFYMEKGYHSYWEMTDIFYSSFVKDELKKYKVTPHCIFSEAVLRDAFKDTQEYTKRICTRKILLSNIKTKVLECDPDEEKKKQTRSYKIDGDIAALTSSFADDPELFAWSSDEDESEQKQSSQGSSKEKKNENEGKLPSDGKQTTGTLPKKPIDPLSKRVPSLKSAKPFEFFRQPAKKGKFSYHNFFALQFYLELELSQWGGGQLLRIPPKESKTSSPELAMALAESKKSNPKLTEQLQQEEKRMREIATNNGLTYQDVPGDGNCFFWVGSLQLHESPAALRAAVAAYILEHGMDYKPFLAEDQSVENYANELKKKEVWADGDLAGRALAMVRNVIVVIVYNDPLREPLIFKPKGATQTVIFGHQGNTHFVALLNGFSPSAQARKIVLQNKIETAPEIDYVLASDNKKEEKEVKKKEPIQLPSFTSSTSSALEIKQESTKKIKKSNTLKPSKGGLFKKGSKDDSDIGLSTEPIVKTKPDTAPSLPRRGSFS